MREWRTPPASHWIGCPRESAPTLAAENETFGQPGSRRCLAPAAPQQVSRKPESGEAEWTEQGLCQTAEILHPLLLLPRGAATKLEQRTQ